MTADQILKIIQAHLEEYTADMNQYYLQAQTSDKTTDYDYYSFLGHLVTAKVAALSRVLHVVGHPESASLDEAVNMLFGPVALVERGRDREGQQSPDGEVK